VLEPGQPLWLESDTDEALALRAYEASICPQCQQPLAETQATHPNGRPVYGYKAKAIECQGCRAVSVATKEHREAEHPTALTFALEQFETPIPR
jgi:uncharacterized protein with PIN domain